MKTILLPFYDDDVSQRAFEVCARIVLPAKGYLEGLFVMRRPPIIDGASDVLDESLIVQFEEECQRVAARSRTRFEASAAAQGLTVEAVAASNTPAAGWSEIAGVEGQVVGSHGRLFDLVVMGREFGHPWLNWRVMIESALFESGRPVLLTPAKPGPTVGENVVIAWNSSTETARTVAYAMPLLARAHTVTILSVEDWGVPGPSGDELAVYLARAGVPVTARTVQPKGRTPGVAVLDECVRSGADLLVKGAYTQSRLRQMIFGGATRHIIAHAQIPVFFAS
jgi:nucleotide-binding universal stress UspA family protein